MYRLVPDGYVDWIFHKGEPWCYTLHDSESFSYSSSFHVFGQLNSFLDVQLTSRDFNLFGVRFHTSQAHKVWGTEMSQFTDSLRPLDELNLWQLEEFSNRIKQCDTYESVYMMNNYLINLLCFDLGQEQIISPPNPELLTERRRQQFYKKHVGLSLKKIHRIRRINDVITDLYDNQRSSITEISLASGYYDQSHFNRDFKGLIGLTPSQFLKNSYPSGAIYNLRLT